MSSKQRYIRIPTPWGVDTIFLRSRKHRKRSQLIISKHFPSDSALCSARLRPFYEFMTGYPKADMDTLMTLIRKRKFHTSVRRAPNLTIELCVYPNGATCPRKAESCDFH